MDIKQWLQERRKEGNLSLREVAAKTGLSHTTIHDIIKGKGKRPSPETIKKLASAFGGETLEVYLFELAGYRVKYPGLTPGVAVLLDRIRPFNDAEIVLMLHFADFIIKIGK